MEALIRLLDAIERLPKWAQPAVLGAVLLFGIVSLRMLAAASQIVRGEVPLLTLVGTLLVAGAAGGLGGLAYGLVGERARRIRRLGPYLAGLVVMIAYLWPLMVLLFVLDPEIRSAPRPIVFASGIVTLFFGLIVGHLWFRPRRPE